MLLVLCTVYLCIYGFFHILLYLWHVYISMYVCIYYITVYIFNTELCTYVSTCDLCSRTGSRCTHCVHGSGCGLGAPYRCRHKLLGLSQWSAKQRHKRVSSVLDNDHNTSARVCQSPQRLGLVQGWQIGSVAGFFPSTSAITCNSHSTIAPYSSLSQYCSYQNDKGSESGKLKYVRSDFR
jgi:hypothetical protein